MKTRYVVLRHSGIPEPHFDLMFDTGPDGLLATWRTPIWPIDRPTTLTRLPDHRREYLTYEGDVSGNRGRVDRVAEGWCELKTADGQWSVRWSDSPIATLFLNRQTKDAWTSSIPELA